MPQPHSELLWGFSRLPESYTVLDTETTDLIKDGVMPDIVTVGLVAVDNGVVGEPVEFNCRPEKPMHPIAVEIHGITDAEAATFPTFDEQWPEIASLITGRLVVIHNAAFDWPILTTQLGRYMLPLPDVEGIFCSQTSASPWAGVAGVTGSSRGPSLDALTAYFGVQDKRAMAGGTHGAGIDAWQTAMVVEHLRRNSASEVTTPAKSSGPSL